MLSRIISIDNIRFAIALLLFLGMGLNATMLPGNADAANTNEKAKQLHATHIEPAFVERGATNFQVTLRARVTNNGNSEAVTLDVVGRDKDGYILQNVRFTGIIGIGETRILMEWFQMRGEAFEQVVTWEPR